MFGQERAAVIDHDRLRQDARPSEPGNIRASGIDEHRIGEPVVRPTSWRPPTLRNLEGLHSFGEDAGHIDGLRGTRRKSEPEDAPRIEVDRDGEVRAHPLSGDRCNGEHVQRSGVQKDELTRAARRQAAVRGRWPIRYRPFGFR